MINNIFINIETRDIKKKDYDFLGVAGENNIEQIAFKLSAFINGEAILEIEKYNKEGKLETHYFELQKQDEAYVFEVKSSLLDVAKPVKMQLHITTENVEIFKSKTFTMKVYEAINATETIPEQYTEWIDIANSKIAILNKLSTDFTQLKQEVEQAETSRNTAEEKRQNAEDNRKTYIDNLKKDVESGEYNGATFTPHLDAEGNLSWSNNKNLDNPQTINIKGPEGKQGKPGEPGEQGIPGKDGKDGIDGINGVDGKDGYTPVAGLDYFTEKEKEEFKTAVVEESKTEINEHTEVKKIELDNYTTDSETSLKNELDTYEIEKEVQLDIHRSTLETEMSNTKDSLVEEITEAQNGFDDNVTAKTTEFNNNSTAKLEEYNNNSSTKLEEYNNNSANKIKEFNDNAKSYKERISELETENSELRQQMPFKTTDIAESIHVEDSAKYSRNKLDVFRKLEAGEEKWEK